MIEVRVADAAAVKHIADNISDISAGEFSAMGMDPEAVLRMIERGCHSPDILVAYRKGEPMFLLGSVASKDEPGVRNVCCVVTQQLFDLGAAGVLFSRKAFVAMRGRYPGETLESRSWSDHPKLARWFKLHGYRLVAERASFSVFRV